jgi:hypothetical protein
VFEFAFRLDGPGDGTLVTVGDANHPARVVTSGDRCRPLHRGPDTRVRSRAARRVAAAHAPLARRHYAYLSVDDAPAAELRHTPQATWLYLGEGYPSASKPVRPFVFDVDVASVRSRILRP